MTTTTDPATTAPVPLGTNRPPYAAGTRVDWEVSGPNRALPITLTGVVSSRAELERDGYRFPAGHGDYTPVHDGAGIVWVRTARLRPLPARTAA